jgi:hypothetical protein
VNFCLPQPPVKQNCTSEVEEPYDSDMTHSYRLTEGRLTRYPMIQPRTLGDDARTSLLQPPLN